MIFRQRYAQIRKYDIPPDRYYIYFERPVPHRRRFRDWSTCPGTLHQDYSSYKEAKKVAEWWGFRIVRSR
jgi:hypothetical protein